MRNYFIRLTAIVACHFLPFGAVSASDSVFEFLSALDARAEDSPEGEYALRSLMFFPPALGRDSNESMKEGRVKEIASSVYRRIFMKMPIFPFISRGELEGKFMDFRNEIAGGVVVAVFSSRNQPLGMMKEGNEYSMIRIFRLSNAEPIGRFHIPTQLPPPSWEEDGKGLGRPFAEEMEALKGVQKFLSESFNPVSDYFDFSNSADWSVQRSGGTMTFQFENAGGKGGFIISMNMDSGRICEIIPRPGD